MLGVILDYATLASSDLDTEALERCLPQWRLFDGSKPEQVTERILDAEVVLTNKVVLGAREMEAAPRLRLIVAMATGTDNIDLGAARARGITVCHAVDYSTASVVQHTFALMLALATRLPQYQAAVARGDWQRSPYFCIPDYPVTELAGKTLGLIGYGAIGRAVATLARAIGMQVLVAQSSREGAVRAGRYALRELLAQSDVLSLHCPLTAHTYHLLNRETLSQLRRGAWVINTARGNLIDANALAQALRSGQVGGAGIDVLGTEPPPADHPLLAQDLPNLILTPHSAWASRESRQRLVDQLVQVIKAFIAGQPRQVVTFE